MASCNNWEEARDRLKALRDGHIRSSDEVIALWRSHLYAARSKLSADLWPICEQVVVAACDCSQKDIALVCLTLLEEKFPESIRVETLQSMFEDAFNTVYKKHSTKKAPETDEGNTILHKRKVAELKSKNKVSEAIKTLSSHLENYMADFESWVELGELYVDEGDYPKAAFCLEEVVMAYPLNYIYHIRYAEIRYTCGGVENLIIARKHFAQALKLKSDNARALYGMLMCCQKLISQERATKKDSYDYAEWTSRQLKDNYSKCTPSQQSILSAMLNNLHLKI